MTLIHKRAWRSGEATGINFYWWCEGCQKLHGFNDTWSFDGDLEKPTVSPSILTRNSGKPDYRCHVFIRDGQVEYLSDCSHHLAGQTRPLLPIPEGWFAD